MMIELSNAELATIHDALCCRWNDIESGERFGDYDPENDGKAAKLAIETVQSSLSEQRK